MVEGIARIVEISDESDLARLVEEARDAGGTLVLSLHHTPVAVIRSLSLPVEEGGDGDDGEPFVFRPRPKTEADWAAFEAAAGGWDGVVDVERFLEDNRRSREASIRPPVKW